AAELVRHKAFDEEKQKEAETFTLGDYLTTLAGPPPMGADAAVFYGRIAALTGIPEDIVTRNRGFLGSSFVKHSDAGSGEVMSSYDASFAAPDPYPESDYDRGGDAILDGFT
ncbi:carboxypeptidase, partial [Rhizobium ruizarguesonis]